MPSRIFWFKRVVSEAIFVMLYFVQLVNLTWKRFQLVLNSFFAHCPRIAMANPKTNSSRSGIFLPNTTNGAIPYTCDRCKAVYQDLDSFKLLNMS